MTYPAADLNLIYKHTHRDYRGRIDGVRTVLALRSGGTTIVRLTDLTEAEFRDMLACAKRKEARRKEMAG